MGLNLSQLDAATRAKVKAQLPKAERATKPKPPTEHAEQCAVIAWAKDNEHLHPALRWLHAIPNGGKRHPATARKLKAEGVKPGVADLFLPHAAQGYHGLYIEMKRERGSRHDEEQKAFESYCKQSGYAYRLCKGAGDAIGVLQWYLSERY